MQDVTMRLNLSIKELYALETLLEAYTETSSNSKPYINPETLKSLESKINNPSEIRHSSKKERATQKATEARTKQAKAKIENAMNLLRLENKKITYYSIAKSAGVSYQTVKKYINLDK